MSNEKKEQISGKLVAKIVTASVLCTLLLIVLIFAVIYGITGSLTLFQSKGGDGDGSAAEPTTTAGNAAAEEDTIEYYDWSSYELKKPELQEKSDYYTDDETLAAAAQTVVATFGEETLTNGQLQAFYWGGIYEFLEYYDSDTSYLQSLGLDMSKPMNEQTLYNSDITWEQYFLDAALEQWTKYVILNQLADEAGFTLSEENQAEMDNMAEGLAETAEKYGFESVEAMVAAQMGPGLSAEDYIYYLRLTGRGDLYYNDLCTNWEVDMEGLSAYFDENADAFEYQFGITKDFGLLVNVRHILLCPEGGTTDDYGNTEYTDEQWAACQEEAQTLYDAWVADGASEEKFAELANDHSVDDGSNTNGGLYENVYEGWAVEEFDAWCFAEERKPGDHGLVKTTIGYHLMYYVSSEEAWVVYGTPYYKRQCVLDLLDQKLQEGTFTQDLEAIWLGRADTSGAVS